MTLRMVAGDRLIGRRRDRVRLPTGSPVSTYCSTISRSTAAERASSGGGIAPWRPPSGARIDAAPIGVSGGVMFTVGGRAIPGV